MLLFGEWYLLLYVYIVLQVLLHILTHTIILFPEVCCHRHKCYCKISYK